MSARTGLFALRADERPNTVWEKVSCHNYGVGLVIKVEIKEGRCDEAKRIMWKISGGWLRTSRGFVSKGERGLQEAERGIDEEKDSGMSEIA